MTDSSAARSSASAAQPGPGSDAGPIGGSCCSSAPPPPQGWADRVAARLERLPRLLVPLLIVALVVVGLAVGGPFGAVPAVLGIALLALVLALAWSRITLSEKALRLAVLIFLVGLTIVRTVPR